MNKEMLDISNYQQELLNEVVIILVRPQLGENIGMVARAILNMGISNMYIVNPRDGWPNHRAISPSAGALPDLVNVVKFNTLKEAIADLHYVWSSSARIRDMNKPVHLLNEAGAAISEKLSSGAKLGITFGCEASGLSNDEICLSDYIINAPLNESFSSLNLAQAALLISWEIRKNILYIADNATSIPNETPEKATQDDLMHLFEHLETSLSAKGFFKTEEQKPIAVRNLRNIFFNANLNKQEVQILRGVIASLLRKDNCS